MTRPPLAALALAAILLSPAAASALTRENFGARTAEDLAELCSARPDGPGMATAARNFCEGFAQGVFSMQIEQDAAAKEKRDICFPTPAPKRSATLAEFVTWARAEPERLRMRAADGLLSFLRQRFPCPASR